MHRFEPSHAMNSRVTQNIHWFSGRKLFCPQDAVNTSWLYPKCSSFHAISIINKDYIDIIGQSNALAVGVRP